MSSVNPQYESIGNRFVEQYYAIFDYPETRASVAYFYSATDSYMTFEGHQIQGAQKILEKIQDLSFKKIVRVLSAVDTQPTLAGGVLVNVIGHLKSDDDPPISFTQAFLLRASGNSFFVANDIFRLYTHNSA
ncbi:probable nuclear transport factor 2 [Drosophila obscura]|uniref:probable nuclear transport factor 2 n=1 Tax=Drosophila obscura TaxID=7282 RepID=UPI001BB2580D|nr:probable nuclear transport factor 2 [Drosophila obscura]